MRISSARTGCLILFRPSLMLMIISAAIWTTACSGDASNTGASRNASETVTKNTKNPLTDLGAAAAAGKSLYGVHCGMCHGDSGKGDGAAGTALAAKPTDLTIGEVTKNPDGELFLVIKNGKMTNGKIVMPPVKQLSEEQIWQIVAYVRTLAQQ